MSSLLLRFDSNAMSTQTRYDDGDVRQYDLTLKVFRILQTPSNISEANLTACTFAGSSSENLLERHTPIVGSDRCVSAWWNTRVLYHSYLKSLLGFDTEGKPLDREHDNSDPRLNMDIVHEFATLSLLLVTRDAQRQTLPNQLRREGVNPREDVDDLANEAMPPQSLNLCAGYRSAWGSARVAQVDGYHLQEAWAASQLRLPLHAKLEQTSKAAPSALWLLSAVDAVVASRSGFDFFCTSDGFLGAACFHYKYWCGLLTICEVWIDALADHRSERSPPPSQIHEFLRAAAIDAKLCCTRDENQGAVVYAKHVFLTVFHLIRRLSILAQFDVSSRGGFADLGIQECLAVELLTPTHRDRPMPSLCAAPFIVDCIIDACGPEDGLSLVEKIAPLLSDEPLSFLESIALLHERYHDCADAASKSLANRRAAIIVQGCHLAARATTINDERGSSIGDVCEICDNQTEVQDDSRPMYQPIPLRCGHAYHRGCLGSSEGCIACAMSDAGDAKWSFL